MYALCIDCCECDPKKYFPIMYNIYCSLFGKNPFFYAHMCTCLLVYNYQLVRMPSPNIYKLNQSAFIFISLKNSQPENLIGI